MRCRFHDPAYECLHCESVGAGFMRVVRWIFAALVGFIGGGLLLIILLFALAGLLR